MGFGERKRFGLAVNDLIKKGEIKGPVAFSRDNLDSGSIVNPTFESENMPDGGDYISDWPMLNGLLDCAAMCDLIAIQANYSMGEAVHTGVTMIADGTEEADFRLAACMTTDSGIGVVRHAQAGYQIAKDVCNGKGKIAGGREHQDPPVVGARRQGHLRSRGPLRPVIQSVLFISSFIITAGRAGVFHAPPFSPYLNHHGGKAI